MVRRLEPMTSTVASHAVELIEMARFGDALVAARFEVRVTLRDGLRLDPYHNLYFLRQGPDGWRVALVASAAVGRLSPPGAAPHGPAPGQDKNLEDD